MRARHPEQKISQLWPKASWLQIIFRLGKKILKAKPALPNSFALGPNGVLEGFEVFASWDLGHNEKADSKSAKERPKHSGVSVNPH
jgi:hypothetical protein